MIKLGIHAHLRRKFKATTDSNHSFPIAENTLARHFNPEAPDQAWVSDITSIWTTEGWLYLAVIIDLFSRRVVYHRASAYRIGLDSLVWRIGAANPGEIGGTVPL